MPQKTNTSDKNTNEDILKELKNINTQLSNLNNKIEESNLLARESKSNEDITRYTDQICMNKCQKGYQEDYEAIRRNDLLVECDSLMWSSIKDIQLKSDVNIIGKRTKKRRD
ncbi:Hypothetical predicted protein [Octopus vulgaris]|uniref:Uncharacterized protein n=1 Tax=Octopus vulgaris TaxID=6645 RepID=A0AA36F7L8_OCTVU|nr:Hypothetical predicted protein [Octopus vulgaris]